MIYTPPPPLNKPMIYTPLKQTNDLYPPFNKPVIYTPPPPLNKPMIYTPLLNKPMIYTPPP